MKRNVKMKTILTTIILSVSICTIVNASTDHMYLKQVIITEDYDGHYPYNDKWVRNVRIVSGTVDFTNAGRFTTSDNPYDSEYYDVRRTYDLQTYDIFKTDRATCYSKWADETGDTICYDRYGIVYNSGPVHEEDLPGGGRVQAHGDFVIGDTLFQNWWQGNEGWTREVPIGVDGVPDFWNAGDTNDPPIPLSVIKLKSSSYPIQAQDNAYLGSDLYQIYFRKNRAWERNVPVVYNSTKRRYEPDYPPNTDDFRMIPSYKLPPSDLEVLAVFSEIVIK